MTWPLQVVLDPAEVAVNRTELALSDGTIMIGPGGIDWGDAQIQQYLADQTVGSVPVDARLPNRIVTIPLFPGANPVGTLSDYQTARGNLQQKVALIQREGGWLKRGTGLYADVVNATLTKPDQWGETGGFETDVKLVLECLPDFYGDEITLDSVTTTGYFDALLQQSGSQAVIAGDHPARCRIIVTDTSGHNQRGVIWGFRSRHLAGPLFYEAESCHRISGATVQTLAGASAGSVVQSASLNTLSWTAIQNVGSGTVPHSGSYRVWARVYTTATDSPEIALGWVPSNAGVGAPTNDPVAISAANTFYLVDLGTIRVDQAPAASSAQWTGALYGRGASGTTETICIDYILLQPLDEGAGIGGSGKYNAVMFAGEKLEVRTEGICWSIASGWTIAPDVTGDLPRLPPSGLESRGVELIVKPSRGELGTEADAGLDSFTVQVAYRPSFLFPA